MLPTILSDCLCSLQQGAKRFAFVLDVIIDNKTSQIVSLHWKNALIKVFKNYRYEEPGLLDDADYNMLLETTRQLSRTYKYLNNVRNSHELVCYLMIFMNYWSAKRLLESRKGIFRSTLIKKELVLPQELPEDVNTFIKIWNSAAGQYVDVSSVDEELLTHMTRHDLLEIDAYIHITSPIRRLVDLLNMLMLQECVGLVPLSDSATRFYEQWISELDYINVTMRAIRKVQSDCNMLDMCYNQPETLEKIYDGYCFDKLVRNDGLYQFIVFLPELRLASRITLRDNIENFEKKQFKLYLFSDEEKFKKKIRLQLL
jgi:exoribonuclease R